MNEGAEKQEDERRIRSGRRVPSVSRHAFGVVDESIDPSVVEGRGHLVNEEVTVEPAELSQDLESRRRTPYVDEDKEL